MYTLQIDIVVFSYDLYFEDIRLVEKFEHLLVVVNDVDDLQLVGLKLDGDAHFTRWVHSAHVVSTRRDATNRLGPTNGGEIVAG